MRKNNVYQTILAALAITLTSSPAIGKVTATGTSRVEITMTPAERAELTKPSEVEIPSAQVKIFENGALSIQGLIQAESRGQSSIKYPRKNMKIESIQELQGKKLKLAVNKIVGKELVLSAGAEDPLVAKNMIVYRLYAQAGLPTMRTEYTEVVINDVSRGLYMVSEHPEEHIMKTLGSEIIFRRGYNDYIELKEAKKSLTEAQIKEYQTALEAIFKDLKKLKGNELLISLLNRMDFDSYLRLVAMNYLVKNGDYFDELYLHTTKKADGSIYFQVFPWDLDNTFSGEMHLAKIPGYANNGRGERVKSQMLYSFESRIDQAISQGPALLNRYFQILEQVVNSFDDKKIDRIFDEVEGKLKPYLSDRDVLHAGLYDKAATTHNPQVILADLKGKREMLKQSLPITKAELAVIKTEPHSRAHRMNKLSKHINKLQQKVAEKYMYK